MAFFDDCDRLDAILNGRSYVEKMAIQQAEHSVVRSGSDWYKATIDDVGDLLLNDVPHDQVPQL
jgi:hypothetical protein